MIVSDNASMIESMQHQETALNVSYAKTGNMIWYNDYSSTQENHNACELHDHLIKVTVICQWLNSWYIDQNV